MAGAPFARYWLHNAFVIVEGEKMSKSLGNFLTIRDVLAAGAGRGGALCHAHEPLPRSPRLDRRAAERGAACARPLLPGAAARLRGRRPATIPGRVLAALEDDLNTPLALAALHDTLGALNKAAEPAERARLKGELLAGGALLGLLQQEPEAWLKRGTASVTIGGAARCGLKAATNTRIDDLVRQRGDARRQEFRHADRIRAQLAIEGVVLEDRPDGTTDWRRGN